ncbi:MAG: DUF937 domain-containing protein [Ferruginibacter sp.]
MSLNLTDATKSLFNSQLVSEASNFLGESETSVSKAISGVVPAILSGLINKSATIDGAGSVAQIMNDQHSSWILDNLGKFFGDDGGKLLNKSAGLLKSIFGDKLESIIHLIADFSGIRPSSSASLLSMALPAGLALISKYNNNNSVVAVAAFLSKQKDNVEMATPPDLNLTNVLGKLGGSGSIAAATADKLVTNGISYESIEKTDKMLRILLPSFLLLAAAMLIFYFIEGCGRGGVDAVAAKPATEQPAGDVNGAIVNTTGKIDSLTGDWNYNAGKMVTIGLPNNMGELTVGENSTEYKLFNFLNDKSAVLDTLKGNWFEFTNVHFKKGGAELTDESIEQLQHMVLIAKAYHTAKFKFGGYTDSTGTDAVNIPLSQKGQMQLLIR